MTDGNFPLLDTSELGELVSLCERFFASSPNQLGYQGNTSYGLQQDLFQGTSTEESQQQFLGNNYENQIAYSLPGYIGNDTNEAASGPQHEHFPNGLGYSSHRVALQENISTEQSIAARASRKSLRGKVWGLFFVRRVKLLKLRKQGTQREDSASCKITVLQSNDPSGMLTIKVPELCFQIPADGDIYRLNAEIKKAITDILEYSTLEVPSPNAIKIKNIQATPTECFPGNKQYSTQKRKRAQEVVNDETTKKQVINGPSFEISNCSSSSSLLSSNPHTQNSKVHFTEDEIELLIRGVEEHGVGVWLKIKECYFSDSPRTNRQLQDKWKTLVKAASLDPDAKKTKNKKSVEKFVNFYRRVNAVERNRLRQEK